MALVVAATLASVAFAQDVPEVPLLRAGLRLDGRLDEGVWLTTKAQYTFGF